MDWRQDSDYAFCDQLDLAGWAWQFLRRNPLYQKDYAEFIDIWRQLEAAYGAPPQRDFYNWKQDPRAWRAEAEISGCGTEVCPGENEQILIECWMGAKWGFRKFPIDPAITQPEGLTWREYPLEVDELAAGSNWQPLAEQLALTFDLSLPLPAQLEVAKRHLIAQRQARSRAGALPARSLREGAPLWRHSLRWLDALAAGFTVDQIAPILMSTAPQQDAAAAVALRDGGYRRLLQLEH